MAKKKTAEPTTQKKSAKADEVEQEVQPEAPVEETPEPEAKPAPKTSRAAATSQPDLKRPYVMRRFTF